ncbi:Alpha-L-Rha alpha-1,3-L-rhamnosyltransferase [Vibrio chagasii]|nr:Alpha-L-Rha alpha-1,3-L-rhamnosyltransferase [Vibrio chagasii]CAH7416880.1 Alpha-L-Rha alpha-1,3-L-rhamnosyltransferase [Vibrio chagasii]CAH7423246.1 Alpha-L-Rha alpha-1,3-L-rhamnosyltransferase [Vibrio chagasii]
MRINSPESDFTVVVCTYRPNAYLIEQLHSINSSMPGIPVTIFDDSEQIDDTLSLIKESSLSNVRVFPGAKRGSACENFVYGLSAIDSKWVFLSDQDDVWEMSKVQEYMNVIRNLDSDLPQIIFSDASLIDEAGEVIDDSFFRYQGLSDKVLEGDDILFRNCVQGATLCLNNKMLDLLRNSLDGESASQLAMHDWWIAILSRYFGNWTFIDKPLIRYRQHSANLVGAKKESNVLLNILKNPVSLYNNVRSLKCQYKLWTRVSERLKLNNNGRRNLSLLSKCKLIAMKFML